MAWFLMIKNASLATNYPDVCAACMMYLTVPATEAMVKRAFFKLKLIKSYFNSSMALEKLSSLALLSIKNERAQNLDFRKVIRQLTKAKARPKISIKVSLRDWQ